MRPPYMLITNARSGKRDRARIEALTERLRTHLGEVDHVVVRSGDEIRAAARKARDGGRGTVFAAGGDGTLSAVADALRGSDVALAAIPMGTFNFFARGLDLPEDPLEAADALVSGEVIDAPIGELNGQVFLNNASLGLYPAILRARESVYQRWGRSRLAAYWSVLKTLARPGHGMKMEVEVDGVRHRIVTPMVFAGSNPYQLRMLNLDGAELPMQGQLAFYYGPDTGRFGMLRTAFWLAFRQARKGREFKMLAGREIVVHMRRPRITAAMDGERLRFGTPVRMRLLPDGLRVVVPRRSAAAEDAPAAEIPEPEPGLQTRFAAA